MRYCGQNTIQLYFRRSRAANSVVGGWVSPKIKHIQVFMAVLVTCKNEEDPFKIGHNRTFTVSLCGLFQTLKGS